MRLHVFANDARAQVVLVAVYDNLGKGASGAAVQNLNLMLGVMPRKAWRRRASRALVGRDQPLTRRLIRTERSDDDLNRAN